MVDLIRFLMFLGLPVLLLVGCGVGALVLRTKYPDRFQALRLVLLFPLVGTISGFGVGVLVTSKPGLNAALQAGCIGALCFGFLPGVLMLLIGLCVTAVVPAKKPRRARKRRREMSDLPVEVVEDEKDD